MPFSCPKQSECAQNQSGSSNERMPIHCLPQTAWRCTDRVDRENSIAVWSPAKHRNVCVLLICRRSTKYDHNIKMEHISQIFYFFWIDLKVQGHHIVADLIDTESTKMLQCENADRENCGERVQEMNSIVPGNRSLFYRIGCPRNLCTTQNVSCC